jgi:hypothetical protein
MNKHIVDDIIKSIYEFKNNQNGINISKNKVGENKVVERDLIYKKNSETFNKKGEYEIKKFHTKINNFQKLREMKSKRKTENTMELVTDINEIDKLDIGKPWKSLDNWMKRKKITEYLSGETVYSQEIVPLILQLFDSGSLHLTSEVTYDSELGRVLQLHSKKLDIVLENS